MNPLFHFSLILIFFSIASACIAESLPSDAEKIVVASKAAASTLEQKAAKDSAANYAKLVSQLKEIQVELTMQVLLDEAVVVRDLIRAQEQLQSDAERLADLRRKVDSMPTAAKRTLKDFLDVDAKISKQLADEIAENRASRIEKLTPLFEKYTKAGDLNAAIAIRDELGGAAPDLTLQKQLADSSLGDDLTKARGLHREFSAAALKDFQDRTAPIIARMISDLQNELTVQTKANRLDDAIKLRDFIKLLDSQQNAVGKFQIANQQRKDWEGTVSRIVEESLEKCGEIERGYYKKIKDLNDRLAAIVEPDLRNALTEQDLGRAKELLQEYQMLKSRMMEFNQTLSTRTPFAEDAAEIIKSFEAETQNRVALYDQKELELRKTLVSNLDKEIEQGEITDSEKVALDNASAFAKADFSVGLQGMLLYRVPESLTSSGKEALEQYTALVKQLLRERQESQDDAVKKLSETMHPIVQGHVAAGRFLEAYKIRSYVPNHQAVFRPLTIKVTHSAYSDHLTDAKLIDVRGKNCFLVEFSVGREEWIPRSRIRYAPDDPIRAADLRTREEPAGPGIPVDDKTKLEPKQKAFKLWGASWSLVTIKELTPLGVVIQWGAWGRGGEEVVPRETLRLME